MTTVGLEETDKFFLRDFTLPGMTRGGKMSARAAREKKIVPCLAASGNAPCRAAASGVMSGHRLRRRLSPTGLNAPLPAEDPACTRRRLSPRRS